MGGAVIKQKSIEELRNPPDLNAFKLLAAEYDKLKDCGLTVEGNK